MSSGSSKNIPSFFRVRVSLSQNKHFCFNLNCTDCITMQCTFCRLFVKNEDQIFTKEFWYDPIQGKFCNNAPARI